MANYSEAPLDRLWKEYSLVFRDFDDHTLARWMAQTLGQLEGRIWRLSHPLIGAYRLAAQVAHDRQIWLKRMVAAPAAYAEASCCRAPLLPLVTRDVMESGLICEHCGETVIEWEALPGELQRPLQAWAESYEPVHAVAHWEDDERQRAADYDDKLEEAATEAERILGELGKKIAPLFLNHFATIIWEDQDECLEVRPEDVQL